MQKGLLGCLLNSRDENGQILTDDQIADNIIGVLFAAQDTTASMLTWILKYIHDDPKLLVAIRVTIQHGLIHPSVNFLSKPRIFYQLIELTCDIHICYISVNRRQYTNQTVVGISH